MSAAAPLRAPSPEDQAAPNSPIAPLQWGPSQLVFAPNGQGGWMNSHAQVPTPLHIDGVLRVYFSARPEQTLSLTGFVDLDPEDPTQILRVHDTPILELGGPGDFDEHGIMPATALQIGDEVWLYYTAWRRNVSVPYMNSTGLAVSRDGGVTFKRACPGPVLGWGPHDPYSATSPLVMRFSGPNDSGPQDFRAYYSSGDIWREVDGKMEHSYDLKEAVSEDGVHWRQTGRALFERAEPMEALVRPAVWRSADGRLHQLFSARGFADFRGGAGSYRMGYGVSDDGGARWIRRDECAGIAPAETGWDAGMAAYPQVTRVGSDLGVFYNGAGFGVGGFGFRRALNAGAFSLPH